MRLDTVDFVELLISNWKDWGPCDDWLSTVHFTDDFGNGTGMIRVETKGPLSLPVEWEGSIEDLFRVFALATYDKAARKGFELGLACRK